ncbi:MAG: TrkA C-terminal domain-containing protein, partial [Propionibacteriaceae bacterium]
FAGSTTNTPALAAAIEQAPHGHPTVGYSIAYPFGVIIMLAGSLVALRIKRNAAQESPDITNLTIHVEKTGLPTIAQLQDELGVIFSRIDHHDTIVMAANQIRPERGDRVVAVGSSAAVKAAAAHLGHASGRLLDLERCDIHYRRVTISQRDIIGKKISDLDLWSKFGGTITRVRRMDQDMLASPDLVLQEADRVRVAAPRSRMSEIVEFLGDSEHASADINAIGLATGLAIALIIGSIAIPLPMGSKFALGSAAGPLIIGMILGRVRRTGPLIWTLPAQAADALSHFGLLIFLAFAGGRAGGPFVKAIQSPEGAKIAGLAIIVTSIYAGLLYVVGKQMAGVNGAYLAGLMAGAQTQPAVLATANERTHHDSQVSLGYATAYPVAMIVKIMVIPFLLL